MNAGNISGWEVTDTSKELQSNILSALQAIKEDNTDETGAPFMFAVGDGNHSLATAKAVWDEYKTKAKRVPIIIKNHKIILKVEVPKRRSLVGR